MNTNKALYWITLAVVAFGFSSEYQRGGLACLHSVAECTEARLCRLTTHAHHALLAMGLLTGHSQFSATDDYATAQADHLAHAADMRRAGLDRAMAARDLQLERAQARLAQVQEALEHAQMARVRVLETSGVKMINGVHHRVITICPQSGRKIRIEAGPDLADIDTDLSADETGAEF